MISNNFSGPSTCKSKFTLCVKFAKGSPRGGGEGGVIGGEFGRGGEGGGGEGGSGEGGGGKGGGGEGGGGEGGGGEGGGGWILGVGWEGGGESNIGGGRNGERSISGEDGGKTFFVGIKACSYVKVTKIAKIYKILDTAIPAATTKLVLTIPSAFVRNQSIFEKTTFLDWSYQKNKTMFIRQVVFSLNQDTKMNLRLYIG